MFTRFSVFIFVISSFLLLNGCYTTTHRGPWTVKPGKISPSINYLWFKGTEADTDDDPMELIGIEGRIGLIGRNGYRLHADDRPFLHTSRMKTMVPIYIYLM